MKLMMWVVASVLSRGGARWQTQVKGRCNETGHIKAENLQIVQNEP